MTEPIKSLIITQTKLHRAINPRASRRGTVSAPSNEEGFSSWHRVPRWESTNVAFRSWEAELSRGIPVS